MVLASKTRPKVGETCNGDGVFARHFDAGCLFAVIDGLGHGPAAEQATQAGLEALDAFESLPSVLDAIEAMHAGMRRTRGAAAMVCTATRDGALRGCGVGNVELRTTGGKVSTSLSPGILGRKVRRFARFDGTLKPGMRLFLFSDGISSRFATGDTATAPLDDACSQIHEAFARDRDDATLLVAEVRLRSELHDSPAHGDLT